MFIRLKKASGIYSNLVKTFGTDPKPKQRQRNSYRFPDHLNLTNFDDYLLKGIAT